MLRPVSINQNKQSESKWQMDMEQIKPNQRRIKNSLRFIDKTQSEDVKRDIFCELGRQCYYANGLGNMMERHRANTRST
jgi:hypothetical protein